MKPTSKKAYSFLRFLAGALAGSVLVLIFTGVWYVKSFVTPAGIPTSQLIDTLQSGVTLRQHFQDTTVTFLILGLDDRNDTLESTLLTDTIILASLDTREKSLTLIPIPRDLWSNEYKTKINALYFYGQQRADESGPSFISKTVSHITGILIDYYVVLDYNNLPDFIDTLGGITVAVAEAFVDDTYPNPDYISDPQATQYIRVSFEEGDQHMDGEKALQYVRSRHSSGDQGTDEGRSQRQLHLIRGIIDHMTSRQMLADPHTLGTLYRIWSDEITTNLTDREIVAMGAALSTKHINLRTVQIPTSFDTQRRSILINPPVDKYGLWVWEPVDPTWGELREFVKAQLDPKNSSR